MRNYVTEFVGTFFLVLTVGLTVLSGSPLAPLAIGSSLMIMVYMGGHISGGHYNPAVSLAVLLRGKIDTPTFVAYIAIQFVAAIVASFVVYLILHQTFAPAPAPTATALGALLIEVLYTFALCLVVLNVATASDTQGNSYYGLAIGFTIVVAAFAGGGISGGAFNPAVGLGPIVTRFLLGQGSLGDLWLYLVGPFVGGALAAGVYRLQYSVEAVAS
jgi:aquaporin Z